MFHLTVTYFLLLFLDKIFLKIRKGKPIRKKDSASVWRPVERKTIASNVDNMYMEL